MTDEQPTTPADEEYADLWSFLEEGGFRFPTPIASKAHPYERDERGRVRRDAAGRPIGGKVYYIPSPDATTGLRLTALAEITKRINAGQDVSERDVARLNMDDEQEREFAQQVLGPTYEEVQEDGVDWTIIQRMIQYAFLFFSMGEEVARKAAEDGLLNGGKAVRPAMNRAERRALRNRGTSPTR